MRLLESGLAPCGHYYIQEGTFVSVGNGGRWWSNHPHPNAVKVYVNWLSVKGQALYSKERQATCYHRPNGWRNSAPRRQDCISVDTFINGITPSRTRIWPCAGGARVRAQNFAVIKAKETATMAATIKQEYLQVDGIKTFLVSAGSGHPLPPIHSRRRVVQSTGSSTEPLAARATVYATDPGSDHSINIVLPT
jgi:hypothetical protein